MGQLSVVHSDELNLDVDVGELACVVASALGCGCRLTPLAVKCTYPVFRGDCADGASVFVKVGLWDEWHRTVRVLSDVVGCPLFPSFVTDSPIAYRDRAVFVMSWVSAAVVCPEDFTPRQATAFAAGCVTLSNALQRARDFTPLAASAQNPDRLFGILEGYCRRHPLSGRLLRTLREIPEPKRTYGSRPLAVVHGDFHAKNFGFDGDELARVVDFDKLTLGLACGDCANALIERFSCRHLSRTARRRLAAMTRQVVAATPWPREDFVVAANVLRLSFAARRIEKHPDAPWVALDILLRDLKIRDFLVCL